MWIMSKTGFISVVQHNDDPSKFRVRARRIQHLLDTFPFISRSEVIDLGRDAPDYRFHVNVNRELVADVMTDALEDIDYESHAKEAMAGDDDVYYSALMKTWSAMHALQDRAERGLRTG